MTTHILYMDRDEFLELQREVKAAAADEAETRELLRHIHEQQQKLAIAEAELAEAESKSH